jgi:hypothetical protein
MKNNIATLALIGAASYEG